MRAHSAAPGTDIPGHGKIDGGVGILAPSTDMPEVRTVSTAVTPKPKCYVYVCAGCDLFDVSERSDARTCSTKCRVRAHRNGSLQTLRALADRMDIPAALIQQAVAVQRLRPDLFDQVGAGKVTFDDISAEVWAAFWALLMQQMEQEVAH